MKSATCSCGPDYAAAVALLILIPSVVWVPIGVLIGLRPALAEKIQPLAQLLAAFPANLLFPVFVIIIVRFSLNPDVWLSQLIVLGKRWYILFNVIAGASAYPNDYREVATNFDIRCWQWWRKAILPGIFPYYVTGAITASGGAWNASNRRGVTCNGATLSWSRTSGRVSLAAYRRGRLSKDRSRGSRHVAVRYVVQPHVVASDVCLCGIGA